MFAADPRLKNEQTDHLFSHSDYLFKAVPSDVIYQTDRLYLLWAPQAAFQIAVGLPAKPKQTAAQVGWEYQDQKHAKERPILPREKVLHIHLCIHQPREPIWQCVTGANHPYRYTEPIALSGKNTP